MNIAICLKKQARCTAQLARNKKWGIRKSGKTKMCAQCVTRSGVFASVSGKKVEEKKREIRVRQSSACGRWRRSLVALFMPTYKSDALLLREVRARCVNQDVCESLLRNIIVLVFPRAYMRATSSHSLVCVPYSATASISYARAKEGGRLKGKATAINKRAFYQTLSDP